MNGKEISERVVFWGWVIIAVMLLGMACFGCASKFSVGNSKHYHKSYDGNRGNRVY